MKLKYSKVVVFGLFFFTSISFFAQTNRGMWTELKDTGKIQEEKVNSEDYKAFELNFNALKNVLVNAPKRGELVGKSNTIVQFPNANGKLESFRVVEASTMVPELQARYPDIRSYAGEGIDDPTATIRFSVSPQKGLSTLLRSGVNPTTIIEPNSVEESLYTVYEKVTSSSGSQFECLTDDVFDEKAFELARSQYASRDADTGTFHTFRLALSCTGEYGTWAGGDVPSVMAAFNTTMTRVNGVFETDFAATMVMIANEADIIYFDAATDPYSTLPNWNGELQSTLTSVIGEANYDIGHLFGASGGGGNAGCIGCVCVDGQKGSGITSPADGNPSTDTFDIDYVAHEMGHQFGANHTFTHNNEGTGANLEPGSGSTIMGYAGITGSTDVQPHSDAYFHFFSIEQATAHIASRTCDTETTLTQATPTVNAGSDYTIPATTAFVLEGQGTSDGSTTFCWEQNDIGGPGNTFPDANDTSGPSFRSLTPTASPNRFMPAFATVLGGSLGTQWETVNNVSRTYSFKLTVRDNIAGGGQNKIDDMTVTVDDAAGPFAVTSQNSATTWDAGSSQTITWDVAGTNSGSVNTPNVDIFVTPDNGATFIQVANDVPNNGSASITVPNNTTSNARVMVRGAGNIFYAINSANITIQASEFVMNFANSTMDVCTPNNAVYNFTYNTFLGFSETTNFSATGNPTGSTVTFSPTSATADGTAVTMTVSGITDAMIGSYTINVQGTATTVTKNADVSLNVYSGTFSAPTLTYPVDGATDVMDPITLQWNTDANATSYNVEIATDAGFTSIVESANVNTNSYIATMLMTNETQYFWRVTPSNSCGTGSPSSTFSFTTANIVCDTFELTGLSDAIGPNSGTVTTSTIDVNSGVDITDVNIQINLNHTWVSDLDITITSPSGTVVELTSDNGSSGDDYIDTIFDDDASTSITAGSAPFTGSFIPEQALSAFNGESSFGTWTLSITDDANQDGGTLNSWSVYTCGAPIPDLDGDGIDDVSDNCPTIANVDQADNDLDGMGDVCDDDDDNDTILDVDDNCPWTANTDQSDIDGDGMGDVCDDDMDGDGILNVDDNCPMSANADQSDIDGDGIGDVCDDDMDGDGILNVDDNCPSIVNPGQEDNDNDGIGDICDDDDDNDTVLDIDDNCPLTPNTDQADTDGDGLGDVCEDCDGDGVINYYDPDTCDMVVSEGFSPNNDGINDLWVIQNIEYYPNAVVKVFNRWGAEVFSATGYLNTWDGVSTRGSSNNNKLPVGAYLYVVEPNETGIQPIYGWLYINY